MRSEQEIREIVGLLKSVQKSALSLRATTTYMISMFTLDMGQWVLGENDPDFLLLLKQFEEICGKESAEHVGK